MFEAASTISADAHQLEMMFQEINFTVFAVFDKLSMCSTITQNLSTLAH
jgi:hypothetical protein